LDLIIDKQVMDLSSFGTEAKIFHRRFHRMKIRL
jgi:hypothetical protein